MPRRVVAALVLLTTYVSAVAPGVDDLHRLLLKLLSANHDACAGTYVPGHVYLTMANRYHLPLVQLQRKALELAGARACVESQFALVCIDTACMNDCVLFDIPNCVHISSHADIGEAGYNSKQYWATSLVHHAIIRDTLALANVKTMCLIDADVLLFDNPTKYFDVSEYGFRHQTESGVGCNSTVNGGFLCFRNEPAALAFAEELIRRNETWLNGAVDQMHMPAIAESVNLSRCALPKQHFIGHCPISNNGTDLYKGLVAYHTNCVTGGEHIKFELMSHVYDVMRDVAPKNDTLTYEQGGVR